MNYIQYCQTPSTPLYPKEWVTYRTPDGKIEKIKIDELEGKQLEPGTIITQLVGNQIGAINQVPGNPTYANYSRTIKYGVTPAENDTAYRKFPFNGLGPVNPNIGFNQEYYKQ